MTQQLPINISRARRPLTCSCPAKRPRASPIRCLSQLPSELHTLLLDAIRSTGVEEQPPRQQPILRLQSLRRMRSSLHAVLYFKVFLTHYADVVREVDVLYPAHAWHIREYHDRSTHSPVLLTTIARSSASRLRVLRLPFYEFAGAETILPTVFEECTQLETLAFDDGGRVDHCIGKLLAASAIVDLTVNQPGKHTMAALRDGLHSLRTLRLHMLDRKLIADLRSLLSSSCLTQLEDVGLEFSERRDVMMEYGGAGGRGNQKISARCDVTTFLDDLGQHLVQWVPSLQKLKLDMTSSQTRRSGSVLRRKDVDAVNNMAESIVASRTRGTTGGGMHDVRRVMQLSASSSSQLQRMQHAMQEACRVADVRLDIDGYGVFVPLDAVPHGCESASDYVVSRVNMRPVIITKVFGYNEFPDEEFRPFSKLEEVFIHFDKIMTYYSSHLWAFWRNCGTRVQKASMWCCAEKRREESSTDCKQTDDGEQQRRERMDVMIFHMTVALKSLKMLEISMCAFAGAVGSEDVLPKWMRRMLAHECLAQVRHLYIVVCDCAGAVGAFVLRCTSILQVFCELPNIESVHALRGGRPCMHNVGLQPLDDAARGVRELRERYAHVYLDGVATALNEWRDQVAWPQC